VKDLRFVSGGAAIFLEVRTVEAPPIWTRSFARRSLPRSADLLRKGAEGSSISGGGSVIRWLESFRTELLAGGMKKAFSALLGFLLLFPRALRFRAAEPERSLGRQAAGRGSFRPGWENATSSSEPVMVNKTPCTTPDDKKKARPIFSLSTKSNV